MTTNGSDRSFSEQPELLREALLDLERARESERELRMESESLLAGLNALILSGPKEDFPRLLSVFREAVAYEQACVLAPQDGAVLRSVAATSEQLRDTRWAAEPIAKRLRTGRAVAVFDIKRLPDWDAQPEAVRAGVKSALYLPLTDQPSGPVLLCVHSSRAFFTRPMVRTASRLAPLFSHALHQQKLRSALLRRERLFHLSADLLCIVTYDGRLRQWNPAWERTLGLSTDALKDSVFVRELVHPDDGPVAIDAFERLQRAGDHPVTFDCRCRDASGGYRWFRWSATASEEELLIYASGRDITAQKESESLRNRLFHADRLAQLGTLAASVAHEINNPASFVLANNELVRGWVEDLARDIDQVLKTLRDNEDAEGCSRVDRHVAQLDLQSRFDDMRVACADSKVGIQRISGIVQHLGTFARADTGKVGRVDINDVIRAALTMVENQIRFGARLEVDLQPVPKIGGDSGRLAQVVLNLLVNAAQAVEDCPRASNVVRVTSRSDGYEVVVCVEDTGCGIDPQIYDKIFEPFFTTKPSGRGTGLGLSLCADIVREHDGSIDVRSTPGQGSTFSLKLPREAETTSIAPVAPRLIACTEPSLRILLVDDEPLLLRSVRRILSGHDVTTAADGLEAIRTLDKAPGFDVIICDLMMPNLDGIGLWDHLHQHAPALLSSVLFCTGGAISERAQKFVASHADQIVGKPIDRDQLRAHVARVGGRRAKLTAGRNSLDRLAI